MIKQLDNTEYLGDWEVQCKQAASSKFSDSHGTIFPKDTEISIEIIKETLKNYRGNEL